MDENIELINGDSLKLIKYIEDNSVDITFTSPPYNRKRNDKYKLYDDTIDDYFEFLCNITDQLLRVTKKYVFFNIQKNYYNKEDVFRFIGKYYKEIKEIIIWEKTNPMPASGNSITNSYEFFIVLGDSSLKSNSTYTKNIITTSVNSEKINGHKAVMKLEVAEWFINKFTKENELVFDPFMGTGTTGVACIKNNRRFKGIELVEEYFNTSKNRIKDYIVK